MGYRLHISMGDYTPEQAIIAKAEHEEVMRKWRRGRVKFLLLVPVVFIASMAVSVVLAVLCAALTGLPAAGFGVLFGSLPLFAIIWLFFWYEPLDPPQYYG